MSAPTNNLPLTRRIVTGPDASATKSTVLYDDAKGNVNTFPNGNRIQTLWSTPTVPADCSTATNEDPTGTTSFQVDGSVSSVVWMKPGSSSPMHRTKTIDYGVLLEGEIELELDNGEKIIMKAGDVIVQRAAMHAWHNRHPTAWAKFFSVSIAKKH